jgi:predicted RecA/RadA family phage recombinase
MTNYVAEGEVFNYTVPSGGVTSGDLVLLGALVGVAVNTGVEDDLIAVNVCGVYEVAKAAGAISQGAAVYFDEDNAEVTTATSGGSPWASLVLAGYAYEAALSGDATVKVKLVG